MKRLKITLADGKPYIFSTFTVAETRFLQKQYDSFNERQTEIDRTRFELDLGTNELKKDGFGDPIVRTNLSVDEKKKVNDLNEEMFVFMIDVVRKSICKNNVEFKKDQEKEKDDEIVAKLMDLIDLSDLKSITHFAFMGIYSGAQTDTIDITSGDVSEKK